MTQGQATASSTYSFSSAPKPVAAARKKYREAGATDVSMYRDPKETVIAWDKRVHRGNTYSMYTQNAIKEAIATAEQQPDHKPVRKRLQKESSIFETTVTPPARVPVDLTKHLVAPEIAVEVTVVEAQTDEFLPETPPEQYQPQKTGMDVSTQVEDGELFHFDKEVDPILDVLINKTLEQSIMEVEEEHEFTRMSEFKGEWHERQKVMMANWVKCVDEERFLWQKKEEIKAQAREQKRREARVLLKIQALAVAKQHLSGLVSTTVSNMKEIAFPDMQGMAIDRLFLPQLFSRVKQEVQSIQEARQHTDELIKHVVQSHLDSNAKALEAQREKNRELERRHLEELQIRQGKVRIFVDRGDGHNIPVGPIQISTKDSIDEVQDRVYQWLQDHEPKIASAWPWGVAMCLNGEHVKVTSALFEAKPGQISMLPKSEPAEPADRAADGTTDPAE